ncbi:HAMP domain-containing sensor histidine kinase [uncultured Roseivirga sp.]|uniref:tetratricopeptide repeat-containing sensor histidine kinase n=1 Tax=uncultured Roseivirga sp. TaxID=543088 RepID=UPI0025883204|nr:HAMP domain-containing sensor histidine kinase [uncultured Roseivirga sp.]
MDRLNFATEKAPPLVLLDRTNALSLLDSLESEAQGMELSQSQQLDIYRLELQVYSEYYKPKMARQVVNKLQELLEQRNSLDFDLKNLADVHLSIGDYFINFISPDSAIYHFEKAQIYSESIGDSARVWSSLNKEASVYSRINAHDRVVENHLKALHLSRGINDREKEIQSLHGLAGGYRDIGNHEKAESFYLEEIALCLEQDDEVQLAFAFSNLSSSYIQSGQLNQAKLYTERSLELLGKLGLEYYQTTLWIQLADCLISQGLLSAGEKYLEKGREMALEQMFLEAQAQGDLLQHRLELSKGDLNAAEEMLIEVLAITKEYPMPKTEMLAYERAVFYYKYIGNFEQALNANTQLNDLEQDLLKKQKNYMLLEQQAKFDALEKEKVIEETKRALTSEKQQKWRISVASLILIGVIMFISSMLVLLRKRKNELTAAYQLAKSQKVELESLNKTKDKFFSIIAHDLRSPMIALQGVGQKLEYFIRKEKQEKILEMGGKIDRSIDQLNHLLNNLLHWAASQTQSVPHHPEHFDASKIIEENLALYEGLLESKKLSVRVSKNEAHVYADKNKFSTIIRNLLSNAIKFSYEGGVIEIDFKEENGTTEIKVTDYGVGIDSKMKKNLFTSSLKSERGMNREVGFGLGLKIVNEFVQQNHGVIQVQSAKGEGTTFTISIPAQGRGKVMQMSSVAR